MMRWRGGIARAQHEVSSHCVHGVARDNVPAMKFMHYIHRHHRYFPGWMPHRRCLSSSAPVRTGQRNTQSLSQYQHKQHNEDLNREVSNEEHQLDYDYYSDSHGISKAKTSNKKKQAGITGKRKYTKRTDKTPDDKKSEEDLDWNKVTIMPPPVKGQSIHPSVEKEIKEILNLVDVTLPAPTKAVFERTIVSMVDPSRCSFRSDSEGGEESAHDTQARNKALLAISRNNARTSLLPKLRLLPQPLQALLGKKLAWLFHDPAFLVENMPPVESLHDIFSKYMKHENTAWPNKTRRIALFMELRIEVARAVPRQLHEHRQLPNPLLEVPDKSPGPKSSAETDLGVVDDIFTAAADKRNHAFRMPNGVDEGTTIVSGTGCKEALEHLKDEAEALDASLQFYNCVVPFSSTATTYCLKKLESAIATARKLQDVRRRIAWNEKHLDKLKKSLVLTLKLENGEGVNAESAAQEGLVVGVDSSKKLREQIKVLEERIEKRQKSLKGRERDVVERLKRIYKDLRPSTGSKFYPLFAHFVGESSAIEYAQSCCRSDIETCITNAVFRDWKRQGKPTLDENLLIDFVPSHGYNGVYDPTVVMQLPSFLGHNALGLSSDMELPETTKMDQYANRHRSSMLEFMQQVYSGTLCPSEDAWRTQEARKWVKTGSLVQLLNTIAQVTSVEQKVAFRSLFLQLQSSVQRKQRVREEVIEASHIGSSSNALDAVLEFCGSTPDPQRISVLNVPSRYYADVVDVRRFLDQCTVLFGGHIVGLYPLLRRGIDSLTVEEIDKYLFDLPVSENTPVKNDQSPYAAALSELLQSVGIDVSSAASAARAICSHDMAERVHHFPPSLSSIDPALHQVRDLISDGITEGSNMSPDDFVAKMDLPFHSPPSTEEVTLCAKRIAETLPDQSYVRIRKTLKFLDDAIALSSQEERHRTEIGQVPEWSLREATLRSLEYIQPSLGQVSYMLDPPLHKCLGHLSVDLLDDFRLKYLHERGVDPSGSKVFRSDSTIEAELDAQGMTVGVDAPGDPAFDIERFGCDQETNSKEYLHYLHRTNAEDQYGNYKEEGCSSSFESATPLSSTTEEMPSLTDILGGSADGPWVTNDAESGGRERSSEREDIREWLSKAGQIVHLPLRMVAYSSLWETYFGSHSSLPFGETDGTSATTNIDDDEDRIGAKHFSRDHRGKHTLNAPSLGYLAKRRKRTVPIDGVEELDDDDFHEGLDSFRSPRYDDRMTCFWDHDAESRTVFVSHLPVTANETAIKNAFYRCGEVENVHMMSQRAQKLKYMLRRRFRSLVRKQQTRMMQKLKTSDEVDNIQSAKELLKLRSAKQRTRQGDDETVQNISVVADEASAEKKEMEIGTTLSENDIEITDKGDDEHLSIVLSILQQIPGSGKKTLYKNILETNEKIYREHPLHAFVTFRTREQAQKATMDSLRIFGIVIRDVACRTLPASNVRHVHLSNIPKDFTPKALQSTLEAILLRQLSVAARIENVGWDRVAEEWGNDLLKVIDLNRLQGNVVTNGELILEFPSHRDAASAIALLDGLEWEPNRPLVAGWATDEEWYRAKPRMPSYF